MAAVDEFFRNTITALYTLYALAGIAVLVGVTLAVRAFLRTYLNYHGTRIVTCPETEWQDCPQDCILQIDLSPIGCSLRAILNGWYKGKECAFCHRTFEDIHWIEKPALLSSTAAIIEWNAILPEAIPRAFSTHRPVCSQCKIVEVSRRDHPELVTDRSRKR